MKNKQPDAKIVASLEALKAELITQYGDKVSVLENVSVLEILFKINSCLFSEYPIKKAA